MTNDKESVIGMKFGKLTVIKKTDLRDLSGRVLYECECECTNITYATRGSLKNGHKSSCGCTRKEKFSKNVENIRKRNNLIGQKFGKLTVLSEHGRNPYNQVLWNCKCECGNEAIATTYDLKRGNNKSCGCLVNNKSALEVDKVFNTSIGQIKNNRISSNNTSGFRGISWDKKRSKWRSYISFQGKNYHLGYFNFDELEKAVDARKLAEEKLFSEFLEWYENKYKVDKKDES